MSVKSLLLPMLCCLGLVVTAPASATILVNEDFSHPDGNLVGQTPTPGPGGTWEAHSSGGNKPIQVSSGEAVVVQSDGSGEDINTTFGQGPIGAGDTVYAAFDLTIPSGSTPDGVYFAHFKTSGTFYSSRIFLTDPNSGGDYTLGFSSSSSISATWGSDLSFDTTYRVVSSYDYDTGNIAMWVDPVSEASTSITGTGFAADAMAAYALRQNTGGSSTELIDNLCVATDFDQALTCVPEPTTCTLMLIGVVGLVSRRRL